MEEVFGSKDTIEQAEAVADILTEDEIVALMEELYFTLSTTARVSFKEKVN